MKLRKTEKKKREGCFVLCYLLLLLQAVGQSVDCGSALRLVVLTPRGGGGGGGRAVVALGWCAKSEAIGARRQNVVSTI